MQHATDQYHTNEILTASPARLQVLLLDGAARFTRQAVQQLEPGGDADAATDAVVKALKIMSELLASLKPQYQASLVKQVAGEYVFVIRALSEGNLRGDAEELRGALRVLEIQRETWRLVAAQPEQSQPSGATSHPAAAIAPPHLPMGGNDASRDLALGGFSLDA